MGDSNSGARSELRDVALLKGASVLVYSSVAVHMGPRAITCRSHRPIADLPRKPWTDDENRNSDLQLLFSGVKFPGVDNDT